MLVSQMAPYTVHYLESHLVRAATPLYWAAAQGSTDPTGALRYTTRCNAVVSFSYTKPPEWNKDLSSTLAYRWIMDFELTGTGLSS